MHQALQDFDVAPLASLDQRAVVLCGADGVGKTAFAMAHGAHPFCVHRLEMLGDVPPECDLLVFDNISLGESGLDLTPFEAIALLDLEGKGRIRLRHLDVQAGALPRIFTTRVPEGDFLPVATSVAERVAMERRCQFAMPYVTAPLFFVDADDGG